MAHELEMASGKAAMFYVGEAPWHGLGTRLEGRITSEQAIKAAGLDWKVGKKPLFVPETVDGENNPSGAWTRSTHSATYRETDGKLLGVVRSSWTPLQNAESFGFFDAFVEAGQATYETAGSLRGGTRIWILAELAGDPISIVPQADDTIRKYLLLSNSHDGTLAVRCGFTPVRVVCANTLAMAHGDEASSLVKIHHHGNVVDALAKLGDTMNVVNKRFEATAAQYRELAATACDDATLRKYVNLVFAPKRVHDAAKKKQVELEAAGLLEIAGEVDEATTGLTAEQLRSNVYPKIAELFETGRGNGLHGVRGTLWAGYNAIAEYLVHERGKDAAGRLDSAWFGQGHAQNGAALKVGVQLARA